MKQFEKKKKERMTTEPFGWKDVMKLLFYVAGIWIFIIFAANFQRLFE